MHSCGTFHRQMSIVLGIYCYANNYMHACAMSLLFLSPTNIRDHGKTISMYTLDSFGSTIGITIALHAVSVHFHVVQFAYM